VTVGYVEVDLHETLEQVHLSLQDRDRIVNNCRYPHML